MILNNKYGYKVCYKEFGKRKMKIYLVTNTLDSAIWNVRWYESHPMLDRKNKHLLNKPIWHIMAIKDLREYEKLWKGCPFKDDLS